MPIRGEATPTKENPHYDNHRKTIFFVVCGLPIQHSALELGKIAEQATWFFSEPPLAGDESVRFLSRGTPTSFSVRVHGLWTESNAHRDGWKWLERETTDKQT